MGKLFAVGRPTAEEIKRMDIIERLIQMNVHFGKGDHLTTDFSIDGLSGVFHFKCTSCHPETRKFRIVGNTIHFLGHRSNYTKPIVLR